MFSIQNLNVKLLVNMFYVLANTLIGILKATFHLTIFDIPMRPMREDQRHLRRFTR